jgi:hypothetical protein
LGGPYAGLEGTPILLDFSATTDPDGDALQFRADLNDDGIWDTDFSGESTMSAIYPNQGNSSARVEVSDGATTVSGKVAVSVANAAPALLVENVISLGAGMRLSKVFTIADPGADTWRVEVLYGDGTPRTITNLTTRTFRLEHDYPAPGYYPVQIDIGDEDGGATTTAFHVVAGVPALLVRGLGAGNLELGWTNHPAPFRLETATHADGPWQTVSNSVEVVGGRSVLRVGATNQQQYFRLAAP